MADTSLIPSGISDVNTEALNECLDTVVDTDLKPLLIYIIDIAPSCVLDELAHQFHVEGYEGLDFCETDDDKRSLIKNSIPNHKIKGVIKAVVNGLSALGYETSIVPYSEYNGIKRHYKIRIKGTGKDLTLTNQKNIIKMNKEYKRLNSTLDGLIIDLDHSGTIYTGGVTTASIKVTIGKA